MYTNGFQHSSPDLLVNDAESAARYFEKFKGSERQSEEEGMGLYSPKMNQTFYQLIFLPRLGG